MEIRVYDKEMKLLGSIENHTSLIWRRRYFEPGEFQLHAPVTEKNLRLLQAGNIIGRKDSDEAGVIEDLENEESDIKNEVTRKGRFMASYFDRRLIKQTVNFNGTVENAMRQLVSGATPIPRVVMGEIQGFTERIEFQVTMKNLCAYLTKISLSSAIGYRLRPDFKNKTLVFEVYKGVDRTMSQGINGRVIFSENYENINNVIYKYNDQKYRTFATIGGEVDENDNRAYVEIGSGAGLDLREMFVDARDLRSEGLTATQYKAVLEQRGREKMAECVIAENMECETAVDINFKYKVHYDLGDIVTVNKRKWGIKMDKRITEITEVHRYGGMFVAPTLGSALPEKVDWGE